MLNGEPGNRPVEVGKFALTGAKQVQGTRPRSTAVEFPTRTPSHSSDRVHGRQIDFGWLNRTLEASRELGLLLDSLSRPATSQSFVKILGSQALR